MCTMEMPCEYEFDDSLAFTGEKHKSSLTSWNPKQVDGGTLIDGDWKGISIEDARNLPVTDNPSLVLKVRLIQDSGSSKIQRILNEYTNGDIVHGFLELKNVSSEPVKFDAFYLSLEGHMVVTDSQSRSRKTKSILKMDDDEVLENKQGDDIGLPSDRILRSHTNYKKEFVFKIPGQLLEPVCQHGILQHYDLPPSLGLDKHHQKLKYQNLKIDKILGYTRANEIGSPIWPLDQAEDLSIDYSIETILVGDNAQKDGHCIIKQFEHFIRIIPSSICSPSSEGPRFVVRQLPYRVVSQPTFLKRLLHLFVSSRATLDKSGIIVLTAPVPQRALSYHSPQLITNQNSLDFKNSDERQNRSRIQDMIPPDQHDPLKRLCVNIRYISKDNQVPPKLHSLDVELISLTGKSSEHIPSRLSYDMLLDQDKLDHLRKKSPEFAALDVNIAALPDAFRAQKRKKLSSRDRWFFNGLEYEQDVELDLEYSKNFSKTLIPSFTSCMCFRRYCIRVSMLFDDRINRPHLNIPIDVRNTFI
ncbi:hypothetical protein ZYGR_0I00450 [Zygosaccharomyces rouxii]|uniref:ZYRO0C01100p n=2 Tax=Zygosaccharomyces rouxii TaxID=4956 RepID=C5DSL3_ZYGRC|nr:uncharacterized protein ZYRO0C01100g [Zygosaccharomyces rouxii]KAH9202037.1 Bul1 N terminus-domain-containing protein [Zygosaccharomyces rouxii]GAV47749.1 hypothetical protein ZYGR_0I00450 [Zygosaccharomyces rouxii]CAR26774.1 ZYRO0C01100p [Zygosaccharomyces rouxii]